MLISSRCFSDEELKSEVDAEFSHENQLCEVCGEHGNLIELSHFDDFFICLIGLFRKDSDSHTSLIKSIQARWNLFSDDAFGETMLSEIVSKYGLSIGPNDNVSFIDEIRQDVDIWNNTKLVLSTKLRFFADYNGIVERELISFDNDYKVLKKGDILYRARITEEGKKKMTPKDMKCPPNNRSKAGRANPMGIPYLYLCQDIKTTFYEVRAGYLDNISVGRFKVLEDLKIIDFDYQLSPYPVFIDGGKDELKKQVIKYEFLREIRTDLSKPLTRYDTELEYVPTQWICEFCKYIGGADGISFASSLDKDGVNYVIFDQEKVKCTRVSSHIIKRIDIME